MSRPEQDRPKTSFTDTGLDRAAGDTFSPAERDALLEWYRANRERDGQDLARFAPFLIEHMPAAFKLSRLNLTLIAEARDGVSYPDAAAQLGYLHAYCATAFPQGVLYSMMSARNLGATKALVLDVLNYAYLSAGPRGMSAVAELSDDYLREWRDDDGAPAIEWPKGWAPDPMAFRSGIDHATPDLTDSEIQQIATWHQRHFGVEPRSAELLARLHPRAYKLQLVRFERAIGPVMPAQLAPLLTLQLATMRLQPAVMRQAAHQARFLGCRRHHVVQVLLLGLRQSIDPMVTEAAIDAVADLLEEWRE